MRVISNEAAIWMLLKDFSKRALWKAWRVFSVMVSLVSRLASFEDKKSLKPRLDPHDEDL